MKYIDKQVKLLHKETKGEITIQSLIKFLERRGYSVVFFNTEEGDHLLRSYGLYPCETNAITYCGNTKIVFVDENIHPNDKRYALLHECGHIVLNHLADMLNKRAYENEAEAFTFKALNYSPPKTLRNILLSSLAVTLIISGAAVGIDEDVSLVTEASVPSVTASVTDTSLAIPSKPVSETVYVTPSGKKYHRANCRYVKSKNVAALHKTEAKKTRAPCSICNP